MADTQSIHAICRRKEAVCRVFLKPGSGKWDVNGRTLGDYFPRAAHVSAIQQAFVATDTLGRFDHKRRSDRVDVSPARHRATLRTPRTRNDLDQKDLG